MTHSFSKANPESILFVTVDSCRHDTAAGAAAFRNSAL